MLKFMDIEGWCFGFYECVNRTFTEKPENFRQS